MYPTHPFTLKQVLDKTAKVGFTSLPSWAAFSPVKNNAADAAKAAQGYVYTTQLYIFVCVCVCVSLM